MCLSDSAIAKQLLRIPGLSWVRVLAKNLSSAKTKCKTKVVRSEEITWINVKVPEAHLGSSLGEYFVSRNNFFYYIQRDVILGKMYMTHTNPRREGWRYAMRPRHMTPSFAEMSLEIPEDGTRAQGTHKTDRADVGVKKRVQNFSYKPWRGHSEDLGLNARIILKYILDKESKCLMTGFIWLRISVAGELLWTRWWTLCMCKSRRIYWTTEGTPTFWIKTPFHRV